MKAFEKWNAKRGVDFRMRYSSASQFKAYIEQEREDAYRAAFGCVINQLKTNNDILTSDDLVSWIEKELQE